MGQNRAITDDDYPDIVGEGDMYMLSRFIERGVNIRDIGFKKDFASRPLGPLPKFIVGLEETFISAHIIADMKGRDYDSDGFAGRAFRKAVDNGHTYEHPESYYFLFQRQMGIEVKTVRNADLIRSPKEQRIEGQNGLRLILPGDAFHGIPMSDDSILVYGQPSFRVLDNGETGKLNIHVRKSGHMLSSSDTKKMLDLYRKNPPVFQLQNKKL